MITLILCIIGYYQADR